VNQLGQHDLVTEYGKQLERRRPSPAVPFVRS